MGSRIPRDLFNARFRLRHRIGAGGTGTVYEAFDRVTNEAVALKVLHSADVPSIYAIKEEFRALSDVVAPNLVALHELFSDGDRWFFTMDLVRGVHFVDYVREQGACLGAGVLFDAEVVRALMRQLVCAVRAIHLADRLHRDLKPSNVMVDAEGHVVVLDFGLVCAPTNEDPDRIAGTPLYMSPEQLSGMGTQRASDWYSVGVILFEALTGEVPFGSNHTRAIMRRLTQDPPSPASLVASVPPDLDQLCTALLARDAARRPSYEQLCSALGLPPKSRGPSVAPRRLGGSFIGRQRELAELEGAFARLAAGAPMVALVEGDSGVGKSTLVQHFLGTCPSERPKRIFAGRCFEHETVPYKGVDNLIDELGLHLAGLDDDEVAAFVESDTTELLRAFPVLGGVSAIARKAQATPAEDAQEARYRAFRSLKELIRNFASTRSVVFFVDDLQWADLDSVRLLVELLSPPAAATVMFVAAYRTRSTSRDSPVQAFKAHVATLGGALTLREISLLPLQAPESEELAHRLVAGAAPGVAETIVAESGGNPLFIELLSRDRSSTTTKPGSSVSLDRIIVEQLEEESATARRLMSIVAAAGAPIPQEVVLAAAGGSTARLALSALRVRRFVRTFQAAGVQLVEPYHDRIRESVYASLGDITRREHHLQLATLLEASGKAEPELLARQFLHARERHKAHGYAIRAAEVAASALAFVRAAEHYAVAIETAPDVRQLPSLYQKRGEALAFAGHCAAAARAYLRGAELVGSNAGMELRTLAAAQLFTAGHVEEALHALSPLLKHTGVHYPKSSVSVGVHLATSLARLRLRGTKFRVRDGRYTARESLQRIDVARTVTDGLVSSDPMRAGSVMLRAASLALDAGEPGRVAWALSQYALLLSAAGLKGWKEEARQLMDRAEDLARDSNSKDGAAVVRLSRAKMSLAMGSWKDALEQAEGCAGFTRRECVGGWAHVTVANSIALYALQALGRITLMAQRADEHLKEAIDTGDLYAEVTAHIYKGIACLFADDPLAARERVTSAIARWRKPHEFTFQNWFALRAQTECDLYEGRPFEAWDRLSRDWPAMERSRLLTLSVVKPFAYRLRATAAAACASLRPSESEDFVRSAERDAKKLAAMQRPDTIGASHACRASLFARGAEMDRAAEELELAASAFEAAEMPLEVASARHARGSFVRGEAGVALQRSADEVLRACGVRAPATWVSRLVVPQRRVERD